MSSCVCSLKSHILQYSITNNDLQVSASQTKVPFVVKDDQKSTLAFHGTRFDSLENFVHSGVSFDYGSGYLGAGFYASLDPAEALHASGFSDIFRHE